MLLTLVLRVGLFDTALGVDEGGYAFIADQWDSASGGMYGAQFLDRPPLLMVLYKLAFGLVGDAGIRVLGALAALALVAIVGLATRRIAGERAAVPAMLVAAALASSGWLGSVFTNAELLAAPFSAAAAWTAVRAFDGVQPLRMMSLAGLLAACASLVKQSSVDMAVAVVLAILVLYATRIRRRRQAVAMLACLCISFAAAWAVAYGWAATWGPGVGAFTDAVFGFRADALTVIEGGNMEPATRRVWLLLGTALVSGLLPLLVASAIPAVRRGVVRARPELATLLVATVAVSMMTILAGGSFWRHYLVQLIPVVSMLVGIAWVHAGRPRLMRALVTWTVSVAVAMSIGFSAWHAMLPYHAAEQSVASFVRANAQPGDDLLVLYGRADVQLYSGLPTRWPYAWTLMARARPDTQPLMRELMVGNDSPAWVVKWHPPGSWKLDPQDDLSRELATGYRTVATICDKPVLLRNDIAAGSKLLDVPQQCRRHVRLFGVIVE